jgi:hypothetical protein
VVHNKEFYIAIKFKIRNNTKTAERAVFVLVNPPEVIGDVAG